MVRIRAFENAAEIASQGGVSAYGQERRGHGPGAWAPAPVHRPGGGCHRRLRPPASGRLPHLHPPRARPHAGQGRRPGPHDGRAVRQGHGLQRRQGRIDAHRRLLRRHAGRQRRGGGRAADCGGRRPRAEAAAGPRARQRPGSGRRHHRVLLRRRRHQPRTVPGSAELGAGLCVAGAVCLRGQPLERHHGQRPDDGRTGRFGARHQPGHRRDPGRRQRRGRGPRGRRRPGGAGARRAWDRGCCTR
jgi:hypothetical protein